MRVVILALFFVSFLRAAVNQLTALEQYVRAPDSSFRYELLSTTRAGSTTAYVLDMVSQNWLSPAAVNRTEWRHWLIIIKPDRVDTSTGLLFINGGSNGGRPPSGPDPLLALLAGDMGAVVADLRMVPNQPLIFAGETRERSEDALIAFTWDRFLKTGDARWPARLPMTKSAVRAMDAVTSFLASQQAGGVTVNRFIVSGASKRGWTAWTTAAVDSRVIAVAPMVIDIPNLEFSFIHHWRVYGFWAPAIQDYVDMGVMSWVGTPQLQALREIEDPYEYRELLSLPKYIVNAAGDQFFVPDSSQFYFADLPGEKYLRYVPNVDHSLESPEVALGILAWVDAVLSNRPRPRFYWKSDRGKGQILVRTLDSPTAVKLWQAANPEARDFRLMTIGAAWTSREIKGENGMYAVEVAPPSSGWTAFFVELTFPGARLPLVFTTDVVVTPDVYPFGPPASAVDARAPGPLMK
ncbi:MAG: PhoPQ-activated pathogenicity-related family protein [Acidobacteria bacterium]|nr:PhoPQ-activated pathogenicity-related family protein [Acidobacteriota bacterium]